MLLKVLRINSNTLVLGAIFSNSSLCLCLLLAICLTDTRILISECSLNYEATVRVMRLLGTESSHNFISLMRFLEFKYLYELSVVENAVIFISH